MTLAQAVEEATPTKVTRDDNVTDLWQVAIEGVVIDVHAENENMAKEVALAHLQQVPEVVERYE